MYPGRGGPEPTVQTLEVVRGVEQEIAEAGEEDVFTFTVEAPGRHVIETEGSTDMVMVLFGPDNRNLKIAEDDDGGEGRNARIAADLGPGEHVVAVRHYNPRRAAPTASSSRRARRFRRLPPPARVCYRTAGNREERRWPAASSLPATGR